MMHPGLNLAHARCPPCLSGLACPACSFNFLEIVELLNCVYCLGQLLEFVAFIWLRVK